ncbi:uncharacterized protein METZ01_LOCUS422807 [marine metagenome]|uniref:Uncharacterized protein n=1 Tax=marine metagenome TaxID=408172 RepID=A0A382XG48_9ZZZZ
MLRRPSPYPSLSAQDGRPINAQNFLSREGLGLRGLIVGNSSPQTNSGV